MLREITPRAIPPQELVGTVWAELARLQGVPPSQAIKTAMVDVVPPARSNLQPLASVDQEARGDFRVQSLVVDFGPDVDGDVYLDDVLRFSTRDRKGLGGQFKLGDLSGVSYFQLKKVRIVATNRHTTETRDVRAWLVVL